MEAIESTRARSPSMHGRWARRHRHTGETLPVSPHERHIVAWGWQSVGYRASSSRAALVRSYPVGLYYCTQGMSWRHPNHCPVVVVGIRLWRQVQRD
jgi:hypothetical protein